MYPQSRLRRRFPLDERTPNGEAVDELVRRALTRPRLALSPPIAEPTQPADQPEVAGQYTVPQLLRRPVPVTTESIINPDVPQRPQVAYETLPGTNIAPMSAGDVTLARPRLVNPVNPLTKAVENYQASMSAPPDFGQDKNGNQRTEAKRGWGGRTIAFLKTLGEDMLSGQGLLPSLADASYSAADPDIRAKRKLERVRAGNRQELGNQVELAGEAARLEQAQAQTDWMRQRPALEGARVANQTRRLTQADVAAERKAVLDSLKTRRTLDADRDAELITRARQSGIEVDPENFGKGTRGIWIEGVYSDPLTGEPVLRDGKPIVDRTKVPVEYEGYMVTPGTVVTARATAENRNYQRGRDAVSDQRYEEGKTERQSDQDYARSQAVRDELNEISKLRATAEATRQAAAAEADEGKKAAWLAAAEADERAADEREANLRISSSDYVEDEPQSPGIFGRVAGAKPKPRLRLRGNRPAAAPPVSVGGNYAGRSIKRTNVAAWGKDRGLSEAEALKELERLQVKVY